MSACTVSRPVFRQGRAAWLGVILAVVPWSGCAGPAVVPPELATQVKRDVTFPEVSAEPAAYEGQLVIAGGMVLSAKLLKDGTRIVVLQLPLDSSLEPSATLAESQGRFLAVHPGFLDPATLPAGTRITVVGEVMGASTLPLDDTTYTYPTLAVKKLTVSPQRLPGYRPGFYPYFGTSLGLFRGL